MGTLSLMSLSFAVFRIPDRKLMPHFVRSIINVAELMLNSSPLKVRFTGIFTLWVLSFSFNSPGTTALKPGLVLLKDSVKVNVPVGYLLVSKKSASFRWDSRSVFSPGSLRSWTVMEFISRLMDPAVSWPSVRVRVPSWT